MPFDRSDEGIFDCFWSHETRHDQLVTRPRADERDPRAWVGEGAGPTMDDVPKNHTMVPLTISASLTEWYDFRFLRHDVT